MFTSSLHRISPLDGSVVWSIYGAGGKLRPASRPVLMNELFVGLWKQAESLHLPPYGQASTSPVARGHSEHLPLPRRTWVGGLLVLWSANWTMQMFLSSSSPFQISFLFSGVWKPSWSDMLVKIVSTMLSLKLCSICFIAMKALCHTWQVGFVWPLSEIIGVNNQTLWLCSFFFSCFFSFCILLMKQTVWPDENFMTLLKGFT